LLSGLEFLFGAFIVIGHNVFHIVPNEVIILFVLGLISIRLRDRSWSAMGLKQPSLWRRVLLIALVAAVLRILLGQFLTEPVSLSGYACKITGVARHARCQHISFGNSSSVTLPSLPCLNVRPRASLPLANVVSAIVEHSGIGVAFNQPV
jgi:hypothetical protein